MTMPPFKFGEAFMLMSYQCEKQRDHIEKIWNSRDGVTPFMVKCARNGCDGAMQHINWRDDVRMVDHVPAVGERMFVDFTTEHAAQHAAAFVEKNWDRPQYPMRESFDDKREAIKTFVEEWCKPAGQPHVETVSQTVYEVMQEA